MTKFKFKILLRSVGLFYLLFSACKNEEKLATPDLGYDFYPIDSGWVRIYAVDSISFNDNNQSIDTFHFILKEQMLGTISGQDLEKHTEIERLILPDSAFLWQNRNSVYVLISAQNLQYVAENIRTVKLTFPIGNIATWNGNMYNSQGRKTFVMQNVHQTFNNTDTTFKDCITVQEAIANNAIEEILIKSVYCKGLGLIDFTNNYINTQSNTKSGYKVHQRLIQFIRP